MANKKVVPKKSAGKKSAAKKVKPAQGYINIVDAIHVLGGLTQSNLPSEIKTKASDKISELIDRI